MNETSQSDTITELTQYMPNNSSSSTTETQASEGNNKSNIRSTNLSTSVVDGFNNGYDTGKEIGPFCNAILDLNEQSIDDNNLHV